MQGDGNLVEYNAANSPVWSSSTAGNSGAGAVMQSDGNLVVYSASNAPLFASNTSGNPGAYLELGNDGELIVESASGDPLWAVPGILVKGAGLSAGQSITSPNGDYSLVMQSDGNLVEYNAANSPVWASSTAGNSGAGAVMQSDGNLVIYSAPNAPLFASNTNGNPGAYLVLGDGGTLTVDSATGTPLWSAIGILIQGAGLSAGQSTVAERATTPAVMQGDGNLVEYNARQLAGVVEQHCWQLWRRRRDAERRQPSSIYNVETLRSLQSNTCGNPGAYLELGNNGELIVESTPSGDPPWAVRARNLW